MPQTVILFTDGQTTTAEQIVKAWQLLKRELPWLPQWFAAEIVQDIIQFLLEQQNAETVVKTMQMRMAVPNMGGQCHIDVIESALGVRRVFVGPLGCAGVPGNGGGINFHWHCPTIEPRQILMAVYLT